MIGCKLIPPTGDQGQRYEINYWDKVNEQRCIYGWCEDKSIANAIRITINKRPGWCDAQLRDRKNTNV